MFNNASSSKLWVVLFIGVSLFLTGCSSLKDKFGRSDRQDARSRKVDSFAFYGEEVTPEKEQELLAETTIYFGYDKDEIADRYKLVLLAHAKKILEQPNLRLRIDGHTDERGSSEYNIGLGERRAKAVARFLEFKGIRSSQLVSVSYGKEKPAVVGHNEEAWRLNRRAELTYE